MDDPEFWNPCKKATGSYPQGLRRSGSLGARLRQGLATAATVTEAFHEAGFGSTGASTRLLRHARA